MKTANRLDVIRTKIERDLLVEPDPFAPDFDMQSRLRALKARGLQAFEAAAELKALTMFRVEMLQAQVARAGSAAISTRGKGRLLVEVRQSRANFERDIAAILAMMEEIESDARDLSRSAPGAD